MTTRHPAIWTSPLSDTRGGKAPQPSVADVAQDKITLSDGKVTAEDGERAAKRCKATHEGAKDSSSDLEQKATAEGSSPVSCSGRALSRPWWPKPGATTHPWLGHLPSRYQDDLPRCSYVEDPWKALRTRFPHLKPFEPTTPKGVGGNVTGLRTSSAEHLSNKVTFDVYKPNAKFSRRKPDPVLCHVCVLDHHAFPTPAEISHLWSVSQGVPVRLATVSGGEVTFTEVTAVGASS